MNRYWLLSLWLLLSTGKGAGVVEYQAALHRSEWASSGSRHRCVLEHEVPGYGVARFVLFAGQAPRFYVDALRPTPREGSVLLREVSPGWVHQEADPVRFSIPLSVGRQPIAFEGEPVIWLLNTLARGRLGRFDFREGEAEWSRVRLTLSPVRFQQPYAEFSHCTGSLEVSPHTVNRIDDIRFAPGVHTLDDSTRRALERIAARLAEDSAVVEVVAKGHADSVGSNGDNQELSERRANSVLSYLEKKGVQKRFRRVALGESRPKADNRTREGRAINRRVEIELLRGGSEPVSAEPKSVTAVAADQP